MVLRRIFGPRRDKVTGEWRRLHNEELNDLYVVVWLGWCGIRMQAEALVLQPA